MITEYIWTNLLPYIWLSSVTLTVLCPHSPTSGQRLSWSRLFIAKASQIVRFIRKLINTTEILGDLNAFSHETQLGGTQSYTC